VVPSAIDATTEDTWTTSNTAGSSAGVTVSKDSPSADLETVVLSVTQAPDAKKFSRLNVTITP